MRDNLPCVRAKRGFVLDRPWPEVIAVLRDGSELTALQIGVRPELKPVADEHLVACHLVERGQ